MEIVIGNKITLKDFMNNEKYKHFNLLRIHVCNDWNKHGTYMDNKKFKMLLNWERKDITGDEFGNAVIDNNKSVYKGEYNNYIVWNAESFNHEVLNLMLQPPTKKKKDK